MAGNVGVALPTKQRTTWAATGAPPRLSLEFATVRGDDRGVGVGVDALAIRASCCSPAKAVSARRRSRRRSLIVLAGSGKRVLVVSTDPASNLKDTLGAAVGEHPTAVASVVGLFAMNIDPEGAAEAYREKVLAPLRGVIPETELDAVEEQLSGQCTVEIATFDEFSALLADPDANLGLRPHRVRYRARRVTRSAC